jgi:TRAP-type C4-dicarboxylate transport system substrate-binding protein
MYKKGGRVMQKKVWLGLLTVTFIALLVGGWTSPALSAPTKISLGFSTIWNMNHYTSVDQIPRYFKMVEKAANGKYALDIKWYPFGTLLGGSEIYDGVVKGIVDSGVSSFGYTAGRFPVIMTLNQAGIAPPANSDAAEGAR